MPELPEVQTIVTDLQKIVGDKITGFFSDWPKALKNTDTKSFSKLISGKKIISIKRIGKNIFMTLEKNIIIGIHLRMTGKLLLMKNEKQKTEQKTNKHVHHIFYLKKNDMLAFSDTRKFATITLHDLKNFSEIKLTLGIDPFDNSFTLANFTRTILKKPGRKIKEILMDQDMISGIGNIYASEILFNAHVLPNRTAKTFSKNEIKSIFTATRKVLGKAIKLRGTSVSDYRDASGKQGQFQNHLNVYKRHTQKCKKCDTIIEKTILGQRSTFHCPKCQK